MWKEFRDFAMKGNIADLAIAVVIGGAFGKIVTSLVNDIIMPLVGLLLGKVDFSNLFITLGSGNFKTIKEAKLANVPTLNYGVFINNVIDFLIVALSIFFVIRQLSRLTRKKDDKVQVTTSTVPTTKQCSYCYTEIHKDATRCPHCTSMIDQ
jgi:large conductance mechanosensitive channel